MESKETYALLLGEVKAQVDSLTEPFNTMFEVDDMDSWIKNYLEDDERFELLDDDDADKLKEEVREYAITELSLDTLDHGDYQDEQDY